VLMVINVNGERLVITNYGTFDGSARAEWRKIVPEKPDPAKAPDCGQATLGATAIPSKVISFSESARRSCVKAKRRTLRQR